MTPAAPKPRGGCLVRTVLSLLVGILALVATMAVFAPWGFFMGGRFHLFPMWQGWGRMHSVTAGGDFVLFVSMQPRPGRSGISHVVGTGVLCTPRGETFNLRLGGDF